MLTAELLSFLESPFDSLTDMDSAMSYPAHMKNRPMAGFSYVRDKGIEPLSTAWKAVILPLN
jgi:hypothetical protein